MKKQIWIPVIMVVGIVLFYINYTDGFDPVIDAQEVVNTTNKSEDQKFTPSKEFEATCTDDDFVIAGISILELLLKVS